MISNWWLSLKTGAVDGCLATVIALLVSLLLVRLIIPLVYTLKRTPFWVALSQKAHKVLPRFERAGIALVLPLPLVILLAAKLLLGWNTTLSIPEQAKYLLPEFIISILLTGLAAGIWKACTGGDSLDAESASPETPEREHLAAIQELGSLVQMLYPEKPVPKTVSELQDMLEQGCLDLGRERLQLDPKVALEFTHRLSQAMRTAGLVLSRASRDGLHRSITRALERAELNEDVRAVFPILDEIRTSKRDVFQEIDELTEEIWKNSYIPDKIPSLDWGVYQELEGPADETWETMDTLDGIRTLDRDIPQEAEVPTGEARKTTYALDGIRTLE